MCVAEWAGIAKDVATGGAAVTAAIIAAKGLSTWKRQLHGSVEYESARKMLRATYELREGIRYVRSPFISTAEMSGAMKEIGAEPGKDAAESGQRAAYQVRWKKLSDARVNFEAQLLESEALWGAQIRERGDSLMRCVSELAHALNDWLNRRPLSERRDAEVINIIYDGGDENAFSKRLDAAIVAVEADLRPHLKR
jgi:hypothetical protein